MKIRYARFSSRELNLAMQVIALENAVCEKIYEEGSLIGQCNVNQRVYAFLSRFQAASAVATT